MIIKALDRVKYTPHDKLMLKSLFTLMYSGLPRISEVTTSTKNIHNLNTFQLNVNAEAQKPNIIITFTSYKHKKPDLKQISNRTNKQRNNIPSISLQQVFTH